MGHEQKQRLGSYAFITAEAHVLLSLLNRGPNRGKWTLIGGGVEFGESVKEAVLREVREEAGIDLTLDPQLLAVFDHRYDEQLQFFGVIHTVALPKMIECKADGDGSSSDGTRWFKLSELTAEQLNPSVLKVLQLLNIEIGVSARRI